MLIEALGRGELRKSPCVSRLHQRRLAIRSGRLRYQRYLLRHPEADDPFHQRHGVRVRSVTSMNVEGQGVSAEDVRGSVNDHREN
jgi:hypothetical protein